MACSSIAFLATAITCSACARIAVSASTRTPFAGTLPSLVLAIIESERCARLPKSLAKIGIRPVDDRLVAVVPSWPNGTFAQK